MTCGRMNFSSAGKMASNNKNSMAIIDIYDAYSMMADAINAVEAAMYSRCVKKLKNWCIITTENARKQTDDVNVCICHLQFV